MPRASSRSSRGRRREVLERGVDQRAGPRPGRRPRAWRAPYAGRGRARPGAAGRRRAGRARGGGGRRRRPPRCAPGRRAAPGLGRLALGDVAQVAGERRRPGQVDPGDRELDRELAAVGAHPGDLEAAVEDRALLGGEIAAQSPAVAPAQRGRHDQLGHVLPDHLTGAVAEGALGGRVEVDHAALVVHRDHRVERRVEHGLVAGLLRSQLLGRRGGAAGSGRSAGRRSTWSRGARRRARAARRSGTRSRRARRARSSSGTRTRRAGPSAPPHPFAESSRP